MLSRTTIAVLLSPLCFCAALIPAVAQEKGDLAKKDLKHFQGTWVFVTTEANGNPPEKNRGRGEMRTIEFEGDTFEVKVGGTVVQAGTQKLDPSKNPKTLDATVTAGEGKGTTQLGIYELKGDILRACFDPKGKNRPMEFKTTPGSGYYLANMVRDVSEGVSRNDPSIVYDRILEAYAGFKNHNGSAYDKACLCVDPKAKLVLPDENTDVGRHELTDVVHVFLEKRSFIGAHFAYPTSIAISRSRLGCAVKLENGALLIGSFGEYGFLEGSNSMRLLVLAPPNMPVERRVGLIGGYGGRAGAERPKELINPERTDPRPALTKFKKDNPDCWLAPTAEDGWHEIPAVADPERRLGKRRQPR
jgi:uncharacterized protein (TIGR03067 family)